MDFKDFRLCRLPTAGKVLLTAFIALIGSGYLTALGNLFHQHRLADGKAGLSLDDIRIRFHGGRVEAESSGPSGDSARVAKSRMLQMIEPGGKMRKRAEKAGIEGLRALTTWLQRGAGQDSFDKQGLAEPGDPSAKSVITEQCVRCHNPYGEKDDAPYAPDEAPAEFELVYKYAAPGTAKPEEPAATRRADAEAGGDGRYLPPHGIGHLFLITHVHMLSIPVFTLIVGVLFLLTGLPPAIKTPLALIPMLALLFDFAGWWLARAAEPFVYLIIAAGAVYGLVMAIQLFVVLGSLWFARRPAG